MVQYSSESLHLLFHVLFPLMLMTDFLVVWCFVFHAFLTNPPLVASHLNSLLLGTFMLAVASILPHDLCPGASNCYRGLSLKIPVRLTFTLPSLCSECHHFHELVSNPHSEFHPVPYATHWYFSWCLVFLCGTHLPLMFHLSRCLILFFFVHSYPEWKLCPLLS